MRRMTPNLAVRHAAGLRTSLHDRSRAAARVLLGALVAGPAGLLLAALLAPGIAAAAGPITGASSCTTAAGSVTCDLWAKPGTLALPGGATVTIWGYATSAAGAAQVPGPAIVANAGDTVTVTLHNGLSEPSALLFHGASMAPDQAGAAAGSTKTYTFAAAHAGTFLYEAGLVANADHQVAMGMYGALVVRPATAGQAYDDAASAYQDEALVVLGEVDPRLNGAANPAAFDMRDYAPRYFLINGKAYPDTAPVPVEAGRTLLLRYVNAGLQHHSMAILGLRQSMIAIGGNRLPYERDLVAETIAPGETTDMLVAVPGSAPTERIPLYDGAALLTNNGSATSGGMLTFIDVTGGATSGDHVGPAVSGAALAPASGGLYTLTATASDSSSGNSNVAEAEYRIDSTTATPVALSAVDGAFDSPSEAITGSVDPASLSSGSHAIYVRARDAAGNWGPFTFTTLNLDKAGPATSGLTATPSRTNGSASIALAATGDDTATGGANVTAGEYFVDASGSPAPGSGAAMTANLTAPSVSLTATIPAATLNALSEGTHVVSVRSLDAAGNWGPFATVAIAVDKTGPAASGVSSSPNPTNGVIGVNSSTPAVRVSASLADVLSGVVGGEAFIDTAGAPGSGIVLAPVDGVWGSASEAAYVDVPLTTISSLSNGSHTLYVRGKDAAGNWGATSSATLVVDKAKPTIGSLSATPNPTNTSTSNNTSFTLSALATDSVTQVVGAEWFEGATDPGTGKATAFAGVAPGASVNLSTSIDFVARGWTPGAHTITVRSKDAAGNWSANASITVTIVNPNAIFSDGFESGNTSAWSATGGTAARLAVTAAARQAGSYGLAATISGGTSGYVQDNRPANDGSYHARFYFNPNNVSVGTGGTTILQGLTSTNASVFQVQVRRVGGAYSVRAVVNRAGGTTASNWFTIAGTSFTPIEIAWGSSGSSAFTLYTSGVARQTLTGLNTSALRLETVRLGYSAGLAGASGTSYFDTFASTRNTVVGP